MSRQAKAYRTSAAERKPLGAEADRAERRRQERQAERARAVALTTEALSEIVTLGVSAYLQEVGLRGATMALEDEATALCGPKGKHDPEREAVRYGHVDTSVALMGRRVSLRRPRVRRADGTAEVGLETLGALTEADAEIARVVQALALGGVSQRGYAPVLAALGGETVGARREVYGESAATVNRYFVSATTRVVKEFEERRLDGDAYRVLFMDGIGYGEHLVVVVMGVRQDGQKEVLGLREGSTENADLCVALLEDLVKRGLDPAVKRLAVIDGGKGMHAAIGHVFKGTVKVQRCESHKSRNVLEALPESERGWVKRELVAAWRNSDADRGEQRLRVFANRLEMEGYKKAAASVREGLEETLTVGRLGLNRKLMRLLSTTNAIESSFSTVARVARRVTHWQSGDMVMRWVAAGLRLAEGSFRRTLTAEDVATLARLLDGQEGKADTAVCAA